MTAEPQGPIGISAGRRRSAASLREHFAGKRVLITGGLGFIGSSLAHQLVAWDADVLLLDALIPGHGGNWHNIATIREAVRVEIADLRHSSRLVGLVRGQDYLFNLAGQRSHLDSMEDPFTDLDLNCRAQLLTLEACRHHNPRMKIVFASSRQLYGVPNYLPVDERHPVHPVDVNGIHKMAGEWYHLVYNRVYGVRACLLRLTNTYGPRMRVQDARQTFLGWWIRQALDGQTLQVFEDGTQLRDFTYVDDVVDVFLRAAASDASDGQIFNVGGSPPISLLGVAQLLIEIHGRGRYVVVPFPPHKKRIDIGDYFANDRKVRSALGWQPTVPLREGLARTLAYYAEHREHYWDHGDRSLPGSDAARQRDQAAAHRGTR